MKTYLVGIYYKTPAGRVGARNITVKAKTEDEAISKAESIIKKKKGYKIQGGDCILKK
jgi:hypothetical protein